MPDDQGNRKSRQREEARRALSDAVQQARPPGKTASTHSDTSNKTDTSESAQGSNGRSFSEIMKAKAVGEKKHDATPPTPQKEGTSPFTTPQPNTHTKKRDDRELEALRKKAREELAGSQKKNDEQNEETNEQAREGLHSPKDARGTPDTSHRTQKTDNAPQTAKEADDHPAAPRKTRHATKQEKVTTQNGNTAAPTPPPAQQPAESLRRSSSPEHRGDTEQPARSVPVAIKHQRADNTTGKKDKQTQPSPHQKDDDTPQADTPRRKKRRRSGRKHKKQPQHSERQKEAQQTPPTANHQPQHTRAAQQEEPKQKSPKPTKAGGDTSSTPPRHKTAPTSSPKQHPTKEEKGSPKSPPHQTTTPRSSLAQQQARLTSSGNIVARTAQSQQKQPPRAASASDTTPQQKQHRGKSAKPSGSGPSAVRTYEYDIADTVRKQQESAASIQRKEHSRHRERGETPQNTSSGSMWYIVGIVVILLVIAGAGVSGGYYWHQYVRPNPTPATPMVDTIIRYDTQRTVSLNGEDVATRVTEARADANAAPGDILFFEPRDAVTASAFLDSLDVSAPRSFLRSLQPEFMFGLVGRQKSPSAFLFLTTQDYQQTYAGLLSWENSMYEDLHPLLGGSSTSAFTAGEFKDEIIANYDTRVGTSAGGEVQIIYSILNSETILVTESRAAFRTLVDRFRGRS